MLYSAVKNSFPLPDLCIFVTLTVADSDPQTNFNITVNTKCNFKMAEHALAATGSATLFKFMPQLSSQTDGHSPSGLSDREQN